ncbi:MAG: IS30 family transposase [Bacillota bacterium]
MASYPAENLKDIFKTITSDNGSEFAELSKDFLNVDIFFAHPHSSFERGTNEKQNSLVRKFFPKGKSFENVSDKLVAYVEEWINLLPRKILDYSTPNEIFTTFI